jgi:hypothetical protein
MIKQHTVILIEKKGIMAHFRYLESEGATEKLLKSSINQIMLCLL